MWKVNGVPVPDVVDEVVQWDEDSGLTQYEVNQDDHSMYCFSLVPRVADARGRLITQHEFLHAIHDNPKARKFEPIELELQGQGQLDHAVNGVADAFVHLVYWPKGADTKLDSAAAKIALADLRKQVPRFSQDEAVSLDITLRSMAILKAVGTLAQQLRGTKLLLKYLRADQVNALNAVLDAVKRNDRGQALKLFAEVVREYGD